MRPFSPPRVQQYLKSPTVTGAAAMAFSDNLPHCISFFLVRKLFLNHSLNHFHSPLKTFTPCFIHSGYKEEIILILLHLFPMHLKTFILSPLCLTPFKLKTS